MKECWINVYGKMETGSQLRYKTDALYETANLWKMFKIKTIYRIHVKLKPIKLADLSKGTEQWLK